MTCVRKERPARAESKSNFEFFQAETKQDNHATAGEGVCCAVGWLHQNQRKGGTIPSTLQGCDSLLPSFLHLSGCILLSVDAPRATFQFHWQTRYVVPNGPLNAKTGRKHDRTSGFWALVDTHPSPHIEAVCCWDPRHCLVGN